MVDANKGKGKGKIVVPPIYLDNASVVAFQPVYNSGSDSDTDERTGRNIYSDYAVGYERIRTADEYAQALRPSKKQRTQEKARKGKVKGKDDEVATPGAAGSGGQRTEEKARKGKGKGNDDEAGMPGAAGSGGP